MHLQTIDFVVIVLYMLGLMAMGVYFSRKGGGREGYFLGNRNMPWFLAGISVVATLLSTVSYLVVPGEMIRFGIGYLSSLLAFIVIIPVVAFVIIPFLMRLSVTSVYEYLEGRFNLPTRLMAASAFVFSRLIWSGIIIYMTSLAIASMTGWSMTPLILVIGVITTFYTTCGGMRAVMWTDMVQFVILFCGALFVPLYVFWMTDAGPLAWWDSFSEAGRTDVPVFSLDPNVRLTVVGMVVSLLVWNICTHGADQVAAQRYLSTSSARRARGSFVVFALSNVSIILVLALVGISLFYFFLQESGLPAQVFQEQIAPEADQIFPRFIASHLPPGVSGLVLAALLAAAMSSLSSAINSVSAVVTTDFIERFESHLAKGLFLQRAIAVLAGVIGILNALAITAFMSAGEWNLLDLMERMNHLFVAPLGVLFFVGFLVPRAGARAAAAGFLAGLATSVSVSFGKEIYGLENPIGFVWNMPGAFVVAFIVTFLVAWIFPRKNTIKPVDV